MAVLLADTATAHKVKMLQRWRAMLSASPPAPASQVLTEEERDFVKPIRGNIERARGSGYWIAGEKTIARLIAIIDRLTNKDAEHG
jgi:hypothetical protein